MKTTSEKQQIRELLEVGDFFIDTSDGYRYEVVDAWRPIPTYYAVKIEARDLETNKLVHAHVNLQHPDGTWWPA